MRILDILLVVTNMQRSSTRPNINILYAARAYCFASATLLGSFFKAYIHLSTVHFH